ncbi:N-acetylglucosamine kinase [Gluconacetobacter asukensis]|uniref:N-acetylglucosamine kinase n=2 Tax=Gluconacetobacter asukensis TaxID=1017181 RepID=A0A7W4IZX2_9PROT|nr:BadF/BadG/BcrA/BcrD ATPase family protein [Gluconacetobacter asukensis]MBB2172158.1 N-acetylglucosamine kinase [Gluconacetobacter asukensis]
MDSGGSKTLLVLIDRHATVLAVRQAGGTNPFDRPDWRDEMAGLLADLPGGIVAAAFGMAGYGGSPAVSARQDEVPAEWGRCPYVVRNDVDIACVGAFGGGPGILLLAGTGSMVWAADSAGRGLRVGGWGHLFGDEGSAFWIGREALGTLTRAVDGREPDAASFIAPFCRFMGLSDDPAGIEAALLDWYGGLHHARSEVAALTRGVDMLAAAGNGPARRIVERAAAHLARHVGAARRMLALPGLAWCDAGGAFRNASLRRAVIDLCGVPAAPILPPVGGAALLAARRAGWDPDAAWIVRLAAGLTDAGLFAQAP